MSASNIINPNDQKININYLPNPYPFPAQPNGLGAVLAVDNRAGDQDITGLRQLEAVSVVQQPLLGSSLTIGSAGGDLRITGATTKGSVLAGNGTSTVELPVGATGYVLKSNPSTTTGLEWGIDISGVTGVIGVNAGTNISVTGTVDQPIVNLQQPLTSTLGMGSVALTDKNGASGTSGQYLTAGTGGETLWATLPTSVASITAGRNIDISGTATNPIVALDNPLTDTLDIGNQDITGTGGSVILQDPTIAEAVLDNNHIRIDDLTNGFYWSGNGASLEAKKPSFAPASANWYDIATCYNPNNLPPVDTLQQVLTAGDSAIDKTMTLNATGASPSYTIKVSIEPNSQNSIVGIYTDNGSGTNQRVLNLACPVAGSGSTIPRPSIISSAFGSGDGLGFQIEGTESVIISPTGLGGAINTGTITETTILTTQATTPSLAFTSTDTASTDIWNSQYRKDGWSSSFSNSVSASSASATNSGGGGEMFISSSDLSIPSAHYVRVEVPAVGNAQIEHNSVGAVPKAFDISSMGQLTLIGAETSATPCQMSCASNGIFLTATQTGQKIQLDATGAGSGVICNTGNAGAGANPLAINNGYLGNTTLPMLTINNTLNASTSYPAVKLNRSGPNGVAGDIISSISSFAKDSAGSSFEFSKLQTKLENVGAGNQDGTLSVFNLVNGVLLETFNFNGGQNENNSFRPIDLNGNEIRTTATNFTINATASSGNGQVDILTKNTTGRISISGDQITSATAGGSSGRHLRIFLPNAGGVLTPYKIALLND